MSNVTFQGYIRQEVTKDRLNLYMPYGIHLQSNLIEEIFQENSEKELHNTGG